MENDRIQLTGLVINRIVSELTSSTSSCFRVFVILTKLAPCPTMP